MSTSCDIHSSVTKRLSSSSKLRIAFVLIAVSIRMATLQTASGFLASSSLSSRRCAFTRSIMKRKHDDGTHNTHTSRGVRSSLASNTESSNSSNKSETQGSKEPVPLYRSEGLFAVQKPLDWTSNDVVTYIRGMLERDARQRGAKPVNIRSRRNKSRIVRVGHGGTLDPLASGVLVIGVGKGTKELQSFLSGSKDYSAKGEFGFETTTLDLDEKGQATKRAPYDHVTLEAIESILPEFTGTIKQVPPIFSAIRKGGKKMYEQAREGKTAEDLKLDAREVNIHRLELKSDEAELPSFSLKIECGGGTYVRSLIRDIGYKLDTVATMTALERTKQGQFTTNDALEKDEWNVESIYDAIDKVNNSRQQTSG